VANEPFLAALRELGILYSKTKKYILRAEQVDPESRSNIAIFKEQRDALDHVMRALWEYFEKGGEADGTYLYAQIDNAKGHMFRAAYDALDGTGVSYKLRIDKAMLGISNDAISAVYPKYFDHLIEIDELDKKLVEHRNAKDEQRTKMSNLDDYCASIERLDELSKTVIGKTPAFQDWQKRNRRRTAIWVIAVPTGLILLSFVLFFLKDSYWRYHPVAPTPAPASSASPVPMTSPTASP
jgi:hypothetical protein